MTVLVASTVAPYKCVEGEDQYWLTHAPAWKERGHEFFLAAEFYEDGGNRHERSDRDDLLLPLFALLRAVDAEVWTFSIDTNDRELTSGGRLVRICTGRNLAHEWFNRHPGRWEGVLFVDTDVEPPEDAPERLLEVDHPLVGFHVPTYCLDGPRVEHSLHPHAAAEHWDLHEYRVGNGLYVAKLDGERMFPDGADVREHWNTAGALLVRDEPARRLRWRYDFSLGQTDDPCFQADAVALGYGQTWVRHDVVGLHHPGTIAGLESRGLDLSL